MNVYHRYKKTLSVVLACLLLLAYIGCTARIDIFTEDAPERLVIYGYVTNETRQHEVRITRSSGYFAETPPTGVSGAKVELTTGGTTLRLEESALNAGAYLTPEDYTGIEGAEYHLRVILDFDGDGEEEVFEASSPMLYAAQLESIAFKESEAFSDAIEVQLYGRVPPNEENHFSFHLAINDEIYNDSLSGFFIISDKYMEKEEFGGLSCFFLDQDEEDSHLEVGDEVTLRVDVLTKEYADFIDDAAGEAGGSIPLFGGPPANVGTNIRSVHNPGNIPVSGFFSAYAGSEVKRRFGD